MGSEFGQDDGVLVFDPSAFPKQGKESVGVQRHWCGRLGKIDNRQVGIYLGYVSRSEHALVDVRLYLPKERARRKCRRHKGGVPAQVRFRTRHELAVPILDHEFMHRRQRSQTTFTQRTLTLMVQRVLSASVQTPGTPSLE